MNDEKRTENYNRIKSELEAEGYTASVRTISILKANLLAFVTAGPFAVIEIVIFILLKRSGQLSFDLFDILLFFAGMLASIFIHELLHGLVWGLFSKNGWKDIHIGVMWDKLTPFCCCMEPLNFGGYICGGLAPFAILGLGLFAVSLLSGSVALLLLSAFNVIAAGGDTTIALMLLKHRRSLIVDHPTECGFVAFDRESGDAL